MIRAAVINSRQSKTPVGTDPWVRRTLEAVTYAAAQGWTVISSVGMNTWELVTQAAGAHGCRLELVLPFNADTHQVLADFDLSESLTAVKKIVLADHPAGGKSWYDGRDRFIINNSDILLPVSIRPGGQLQQLLDGVGTGQRSDRRFETDYAPASHHARAAVDTNRLSAAIRSWEGDYLIHWTRASHGPWPGELSAQYYHDLAASSVSYCRAAWGSLQRIITERTIRASSWKVGGGVPVVAFSGLAPIAALPLMRWRARWARWSFEPYGIAMRKDAAIALGARAVRYVTESAWNDLIPDEKPFCHRRGKTEEIWPAEEEWRIAGDVDLGSVPMNAIRVIVRRQAERNMLEQRVSYDVFHFEDT